MQIKPAADEAIKESTPVFQWTEPQDAARYHVQLATDETFTHLLMDEKTITSSTFQPARRLTPGTYFWRVATTDHSGKIGPFSDPQPFRKLPPQPDMSDATLDAKELVFRWRRADQEQTFRCQIAMTADFSELVIDETMKEPQVSLKAFEPGDYFIRIALVDTDGYAGPFAPFQKVTIAPPPTHPAAFITAGIIFLLIIL